MFVSAKTVKGECVFLNVSHILWVTKGKRPNAVVLTCDGDLVELAESYEDFCERLIQSSNALLCPFNIKN